MRGAALADVRVVLVEGEFFKGFGAVLSDAGDAADPEDASLSVAFAFVARGVPDPALDSRLTATTLGSSPATRSMASSRASIASTESSMRVTYLDPMVSSIDEPCPLAAGCVGARDWESLLVLIDSTNESSLLCSSTGLGYFILTCRIGSNTGVFPAESSSAIDCFPELLFKDPLVTFAAAF